MGPRGKEKRVTGDRRPEGRPGRLGDVRMVTEPGSGRVRMVTGSGSGRVRMLIEIWFRSGPGILYARAGLMNQLTVNGFWAEIWRNLQNQQGMFPTSYALGPGTWAGPGRWCERASLDGCSQRGVRDRGGLPGSGEESDTRSDGSSEEAWLVWPLGDAGTRPEPLHQDFGGCAVASPGGWEAWGWRTRSPPPSSPASSTDNVGPCAGSPALLCRGPRALIHGTDLGGGVGPARSPSLPQAPVSPHHSQSAARFCVCSGRKQRSCPRTHLRTRTGECSGGCGHPDASGGPGTSQPPSGACCD